MSDRIVQSRSHGRFDCVQDRPVIKARMVEPANRHGLHSVARRKLQTLVMSDGIMDDDIRKAGLTEKAVERLATSNMNQGARILPLARVREQRERREEAEQEVVVVLNGAVDIGDTEIDVHSSRCATDT